jgi:hypothetical protein
MKKGRPGFLLTALATEEGVAAVEEAIFRETTTFGVRRHRCDRTVLAREVVEAETPFGRISVKVGRLHGRLVTATPEFEAVRRIAEERGVSVREVHEAAVRAAAGVRTQAMPAP